MRVAVDVGTHLVRAAYLGPDGRPRAARLEGNEEGLPAVARQTMHELQVGHAAARARVGNGETSLTGCVRLMGRAGQLPASLVDRLPYSVRVVEGELYCNLLYAEVRPSEVYGRLVRAMVERVEELCGLPVTEVTLTVPAGAEDRFRVQARAAVEARGLRVRRLINRPAAALLASHLPREVRYAAVVDCSGGSTDVTIAETHGEVRILTTVGDMLLGGDDLAWAVADRLNDLFRRTMGVDVYRADRSGAAAHGLHAAALEGMQRLALVPESLIVLDHGGGFARDLVAWLRREEVDRWIEPLLARLEGLCVRALARSGVRPAEIGAVLLTGEGAALPAIRRTVARAFEREVAALACEDGPWRALYGALLAAEGATVSLWDVTPYPLGISCYYGEEELFSPILAANSPIPTPPLGAPNAFTGRYVTRYPDQKEVRLDVLQYRGPRLPALAGENRVYPHECELLGSWMFTGLRPRTGRHAPFTVTFFVDEDGILHLEAVEQERGHRLVGRVERTIG